LIEYKNEGMSNNFSLSTLIGETMPTGRFILIVFIILSIMSGVAYYLTPDKKLDGRTPLIWTTDPNPQRDPQVEWYNKLYPQNFLSIDPANADVMKVIVQSSAGMGPDIIGRVSEYNYQTYVDAGILWDITDKAKEMGFGPETLPEAVRPLVLMKVSDKEGKLVNRQFVYTCNVAHQFLFYNKNLFDKYKIPYPSDDMTWDEYIEIGKKLTKFENENDKVPSIFGATPSNAEILIWGMGADIINKDGTRSTLASDKAVDAFQMLWDLQNKYKIEPTPTETASMTAQGGWGAQISFFGEGKFGMMWGARWMLIQLRRFVNQQRQMKSKWEKENPGKDYPGPPILHMGATKVPRFKNRKRVTKASARCAGINKASKNREAALTFLQYLAGPEYSKTINDGADSKPGNLKYNTMKLYMHPDWPGEEEVNRVSLAAVPDGRIMPRSMFIPTSKVYRIFNAARTNILSKDKVDKEEIRRILKAASDEIDLTIARNIKRNPKLMKIYKNMLAEGMEPIKMDLKEIDR
jgi:ABC-type glycerol-3-phosphate transport system substrate-binding protein